MSYNPQNPNGQATSANSSPVVVASDQSSVPVTASAGTNLNTSALALESGGNLAGIKTDAATLAGAVSSSKVNVNISSTGATLTANPTSATPVLKNGLSNSASSVVSSTAAVLAAYYVYNPNASVAYIQIFDVATAGAVTVGSTTPKWSIGIPPTSAANLSSINMAFANGIQVAATTTATGSTAPTTALDCNFGYQ